MRKSHVFVGSSHAELGQLICDRLGVEQGPCVLRKFANGETSIEIGVSVRDDDVYIVQSGSDSINDHIMELLIFISGCKSGSANKITAVIPMFPYSKQSKMKKHRGAITARMLANLLTMAGADHVITMDLHATQMQGFFTKPVDNLHAGPTLARWIKQNIQDYLTHSVIVSKNPGGTKRVTALADALKVNFAMINTDRRRRKTKSRTTPPTRSLSGVSASSAAASDSKKSTSPQNTASPRVPSGLSNEISASDVKSDGEDSDLDDSKVKVVIDRLKPELSVKNGFSKGSTSNADDLFVSDDEEDDVRCASTNSIHTGRVVGGHIVDQDYPESDDDDEGEGSGALSDAGTDCGNMMDSVYSLASQHCEALGGSVHIDMSDDDEDEQTRQMEKLITLVGDVQGKTAILLDDMLDRPGSFVAAAEHCVLNCGARRVVVIATHGIFSDDSLQVLENCACIHQVVVTNTYPIPPEKRALCKKLTIIDISPILAECIRRNHHGESISALFEHMALL